MLVQKQVHSEVGVLRGTPLERVAHDPARSFDFAQDDTAGAEARGQQYKARVAANEVWYDRAALLGR